MSSLHSSAPVDRRETTIVDACVRVAEVSYCAYAEPCDATRLVEMDEALREQSDGEPVWLRVFVRFGGDCHGQLVLHVPALVAGELVGAFIGLMPDETATEAQVADGLGEFANMVCGAFLTDAATRLDFVLTRPEVTTEPAGWRPLDALGAADGEGTAYAIAIDDQPMVLRVNLEMRL